MPGHWPGYRLSLQQEYPGKLFEIPMANRPFDWLQRRILADPRLASKDERVIDFFARTLNAVSQILNDVIGIVRKDAADMLDPRHRLLGTETPIFAGP
jgi:hypothetical protein